MEIARSKIKKENLREGDRVILESFNTSDIDDIVDILELYDIENKQPETVKEKIEELAESVSLMIREIVEFDFAYNGHLCLYLRVNGNHRGGI